MPRGTWPTELGGAFKVATQAADAALSGYAAIDLATHAPSLSGAIHTRWGSRAAVVIGSTRSVFVTLRLGSPARITRRVAALTAPIKRGAQVGAITATVRGRQIISWPLVAGGDVGLPLWWSKLVNG